MGKKILMKMLTAVIAPGMLLGGCAVSGSLERVSPAPVAATAETLSPLEATTIQPDQGRNHISPGTSHDPYLTRPATSGPHWSTKPTSDAPDGAPVRWGVYTHPLPDEALVHNLEHGGIGLHYNCPEGCPDLVKQLEQSLPSGFAQFVLSPYPSMGHRLAITAWHRLLYLDGFDKEKIQEFIRAYKNRGPEDVPQNMF